MNKILAGSVYAALCLSAAAVSAEADMGKHIQLFADDAVGTPIPMRQPFKQPDEAGPGKVNLNIKPTVYSYNDKDYQFRTYNQKLVGPTIRVKPGQTLDISVTNNIPTPTDPAADENTNLHTHGLHASPLKPQDNPLVKIAPGGGTSGDYYKIVIPANHWRGTQWYHPHWHGSTAVQVANGMAGALIVEDDPSTLPPGLKGIKEQIFVFQQINTDDAYSTQPAPAKLTKRGKLRNDDSIPILINGQNQPKLTMQPGEVQRWRLIDADGSRHQLNLVLEGHDLHEIALDGMYTGTIDTWKAAKQIGHASQPVVMSSGNRSDVLIQAQSCGRPSCIYRLIDQTAASDTEETDHILATLEVTGEAKPMQLPSKADMAKLKSQTDIPMTSEPATQTAQLMLNNCNTDGLCVDGIVWNSGETPRAMPIGAVQKWKVSADQSTHPFHIHVNPFQTTRKDPDGKDEIVWLDVVSVSQSNPVELYIRNEDVQGSSIANGVSVLHCHILGHEDAGMMQSIQFNPPK